MTKGAHYNVVVGDSVSGKDDEKRIFAGANLSGDCYA